MPHKMRNIGDNASFISMMENNPKEFPTLTKITDKRAIIKTNMYKEINSDEYNYMLA